MNYIKDESVQSWIFRSIIVSGGSDFSSVIGSNGMWRDKPYFPTTCKVESAYFKDQELLEFVRNSGLVRKTAGRFDDPVDYLHKLKEIFSGYSVFNKSKGEISIGYCSRCISDSIFEYGFGYLKSCWLYENKCQYHNEELKFIGASSRRLSVSSLKDVLSAKDINLKMKLSDVQLLDFFDATSMPEFHVMPCLLYDFYRWATRPGLSPRLDLSLFLSAGFYYSGGRRKPVPDEFLHHKYEMFETKYPQEFESFFSNRAEVIEYRFGFNQVGSLTERLAKTKGKNCSKCYQWDRTDYCPIQPIQYGPIDFKAYRKFQNLNPCDLFFQY